MGTVPFLPPDNPGRRGRDGEARTEVEVKAAVARSSPSPLPCEGCRSWAHVWTTQAGPCGPRPPISFLISLLKVGGAGTHLACHGLPASKGPSVSTKGATRTCGADYRLRMRLPPQALPRVSVSAWGPGPSLAISRAWDLIQVRGFCCGGRASRCACAGAGRPAPALLFGVVGPGMMGTEAEGRQTPVPSWLLAGRRKPGHRS